MTNINSCLGDWRELLDWEIWSLQSLDDLDDIAPDLDDKYIYLDQNKDPYKWACTLFAPYSSICSMENHNPSVEEIAWLWDYAVENYWYVQNKWNWTRRGVECATNYWNSKWRRQMRYFVWSYEETEVIRNKWYLAIASVKLSRDYQRDKLDDWIVQDIWFSNYYAGHAICVWKKWIHRNSYPKWKYNVYVVSNMQKLIDEWTYYENFYVILPLSIEDNAQEEYKKEKREAIESMMQKVSDTYKYMSTEESKDMCHNFNEYFRDKWFQNKGVT